MWLAFLAIQIHAAPALCPQGERPLFACANARRAYVLCASNELTPEKGYVQFRSAQLRYPPGQELPVRNFEFWMDERGTGVTFGVNGAAYELYSEEENDRTTVEGEGRLGCPRLDPGVALSAAPVQAFLRAAGLLR